MTVWPAKVDYFIDNLYGHVQTLYVTQLVLCVAVIILFVMNIKK